MLEDQGSIPRDTLQSQDGLNLGDVHFCPIRQTLHMQRISLDYLHIHAPIGGHSRTQWDYCHPPGLPGRQPA